jgi:cytochrome c2
MLMGCRDDAKRKAARSTAREALASEVIAQVPRWVRLERIPKRARAGARIFATSGCTACHTYLGTGSRNLGGTDLSSAGRRHGVRFFERYIANPAGFQNDVMPPFGVLGRPRVHELGLFLATSRGRR